MSIKANVWSNFQLYCWSLMGKNRAFKPQSAIIWLQNQGQDSIKWGAVATQVMEWAITQLS